MSLASGNSRSKILRQATDAELLMQFSRTKDESCFEVIESRYARLVYQVCRTVLMNPADAEDACQATFLILVRKSGSLLNISSLGAWLYKVAYRLSVRANKVKRKQSCSTLKTEPQTDLDQFHQISRKEILSGVFQELSKLPAKHQQVLVECYLQGKTYREVANQVDSTETVIKGRVAQAKKILRRRLLKRGIALSFVLVMLEQVRSEAAAVPAYPFNWTESISSVLSKPSTQLTSSMKLLSQTGIRRMSMLFFTKPLTLATLSVLVICLPVLWVMNQPVIGQDTGIAIQQIDKPFQKNAKIKSSADPFDLNTADSSSTPGTIAATQTKEKKQANPFDEAPASQQDPFGNAAGSRPAKKQRIDASFGDASVGKASAVTQDPFGRTTGKESATKRNQDDPSRSDVTTAQPDPFANSASIEPPKSNKTRNPVARNNRANNARAGGAELIIEKALESPADFEFIETPLRDVADFLSDQYGVPIHVDKVALESEGLDSETLMTGSSQNRSLRSALGFLFREADLAFVSKNETLIITTPNAIANDSDDYLVSKLYDVTKIATNDVDSIVTTIQQTIDAESWSDNGGYSSMNIIELGNRTILAVSHTSEHHHRIKKLLDSLEQLAANQ